MRIVLFFICLFCLKLGFAQQEAQDKLLNVPIRVPAIIYDGDTIPYIVLSPITCFAPRKFKNKRDAVRWTRLLYNVKKVYPYSILAAARLQEYEGQPEKLL